MRPQVALVRVALATDGRAVLSRTAPGRGAWLCRDGSRPCPPCLTAAVRRRAFDRAFRRALPAGALDTIADDKTAGLTAAGQTKKEA
jgi:predicted RNA-binding protein YlxR (DUF448 family)